MRILILFSSILIALGSAAHGQSAYPARTIQVVVGFPPGAAPDVAARILANKLAERLRVAVVVENATGAAGNIATAKVARAEPDGYTLLMAGSAAIVINPSLYEHLSFDPQTDLVPITEVYTGEPEKTVLWLCWYWDLSTSRRGAAKKIRQIGYNACALSRRTCSDKGLDRWPDSDGIR
jgi:tripartite-type tricarboxylate transporter receptor subunit TctC